MDQSNSTTTQDESSTCTTTPTRTPIPFTPVSLAQVATAITSGAGKRRGKGFCSRRRPGLKIKAEDEDHSQQKLVNNRLSPSLEGREADKDDRETNTDVPWWVLEYRAPPPGHLGAHAVPVADGEATTSSVFTTATANAIAIPPMANGLLSSRPRTVRRKSMEYAEQQLEHLDVTETSITTAEPSSTTASTIVLHDTPERAGRRSRGTELYASAGNHSSPSQKRKIIDVLEMEKEGKTTLVNASIGHVAKELKRFHHDSTSNSPVGSPPTIVTPSKLLHSMTKIDLQGVPPPILILGERRAPSPATSTDRIVAVNNTGHVPENA